MRTLENAIASRNYALSQSDLGKFNKWLNYLYIINHKRNNEELLFHCFFNKFASSPHLFYLFLEYLKKHLLNLTEVDDMEKKKDLAQKYLEIISPLCESFNFFEERNVLNDLCFKIVEQEKYLEIKKRFAKYEKTSKKIILKTLQILQKLLKDKSYDYELLGRYKNMYSIHKKLQKYQQSFPKMNDIFGFRIILNSNSIAECFEVLNVLHDTFEPIPDLFRDYITIPKINGYQSLHTGIKKVCENLDLPLEIQIRTREMHDFAENGLAAHWIYAQDKKSKLITKKEQRLLDYLSCFAHTSKKENEVYCFSYGGDLIQMPQNSTVLDFAYFIHTDLGNKTKEALVNDSKKPLNYRIKEGDKIRIITSTCNEIEKKWLHYAHTKYAQRKIFQYLKTYEQTHKN